MSIQMQQSEATAEYRRIYFHCVDASDGLTPETGEAGGQPQISVNGGAWANTTNTLVAIGNGRYYVELTAGELATLGIIESRYKSANTAEAFGITVQVVPWDPYDGVRMGITALPNATPGGNGGVPTVDANNRIAGVQGTKNTLDDLNDVSTTDVNTEVDNAFNTAIPGSPTANSINERIKAIDDKLPSKTYLAGSADSDGGFDSEAKADINTEADRALSDIDLDHLIQVTAGAEEPTDGSYLDQVMHKDGSQTFDSSTDSLEAIRDTAPLGTTMRGTDNAALASVLGALTDAAADGDPTITDTLVQYVKQLVNILVGTAGIVTFPAEAAPGNAVSLAEVIRAIHADVTGLAGAAMRGTDGANTTVPDVAGTAAGLHATTDGKIDALENLSQAEAQTACAAALDAYDPPTRAELTTDKNSIITEIDANETKIDSILTDTALLDKWLKNRIVFTGSSMILYDDDNVTPLLTWTLSQGSISVNAPYNRAKAT